MVMSTPSFQLFEDLRQELLASTDLRVVMEEVRNGSKGEHWHVLDGFIHAHNKLYVPPTSLALPLVLASAHGHGHEGT
jgi:hypothetical protein